jgi:hypothetical protein
MLIDRPGGNKVIEDKEDMHVVKNTEGRALRGGIALG